MKRSPQFCFLLVVFLACSAPPAEPKEDVAITPFKPEIFIINDDQPALDIAAIRVMEQLKICSRTDTIPGDTSLAYAPCDARYFRVFKYLPGKEYSEGFIIEMVPGLYGVPVHQLMVVKANLGGGYLIANQYLGMLMEMRTTESGTNDLLIGYRDLDVGLVAIRHEWQGEKYEPVDVEEINDHFVKPEMKDSINKIFLEAFNAGN